MSSKMHRPSIGGAPLHATSSSSRSSSAMLCLEEAVPSLDTLEDGMRRNVLMSQHPTVRAARMAANTDLPASPSSLAQGSTTASSSHDMKDEGGRRRHEMAGALQRGSSMRRRSPRSGDGNDGEQLCTFLAGRDNPHSSDMPPQEAQTSRDAARELSKMQSTNQSNRDAAAMHRDGGRPAFVMEPLLKHPSCVPPSQYVKAQLDALRFSLDRGFQYHEHFDDHVAHAYEARRVAQSKLPSRTECSVDFVRENVEQLHEVGSPQRMLLVANREKELKAQRATASKEAIREWFAVQIERKRDMAVAAAQRRAERRAQQQQQLHADDSGSLQATTDLSASTAAAAAAPENIPGPLAALSGSGLTTEREITGAVQSLWLIIIAAATRTCGFAAAAEDMARRRREATEAGIRRRRLDTEHMDSLLALDTMKRKYDRCRSILKVFVQNRVRSKHSGAVDLIVRLLRHRHRIKRTIYQVHWFRRSVIICQRQVRVFLQSLEARKMLLHLQWVRKECAILQVPNGALACVHQQWHEQRRVVETTQRIFATQAALAGLSSLSATTNPAASGAGGMTSLDATTASLSNHHHTSVPRQQRGAGRGGNGGLTRTASLHSRPHQQHHQQHHHLRSVSDDGYPIQRPGAGQHFVIWSTRVSWVPPGGVPLEYRNLQVHMACQSSLRTFVSSLLSADASRKFFVKQKARYETDGLEALGLPKPKLPTPPIFQLFMPSMALRLKVSLAVKEKGKNTGGGGGGGAPTHHKSHTTQKSTSAAITSTTTADDAPSTPPSSELSIPRPPAHTTTAMAGATTKLTSADAPKPTAKALLTKLSRKVVNPPSKLTLDMVQQQQQQPVASSLMTPSRPKQQQLPMPPPPSSPRGVAARKPSTVTLLSPVTPLQKSTVSDSCESSPRRSVFEHFDNREDLLPVTVRSDEEYAQLLGRTTVAAMRNFIDTKNTLHLRPTTVDDKSIAALPRAQRVAATAGPSMEMHLNHIQLHYENEATRRFEEQYHSTLAPQEATTTPQRRRHHHDREVDASAKSLPSPRRSTARVAEATTALTAPLLGDGALLAHRPPVVGIITRRQHEERLKASYPEESSHGGELLLRKPQPPMGHDVLRDVPKLLAFCGSSESQRRLMATGGARFASSSSSMAFPGTSSSSSPRGGAATARQPLEVLQSTPTLSVALLQDFIDAKAQHTARARSKQFM